MNKLKIIQIKKNNKFVGTLKKEIKRGEILQIKQFRKDGMSYKYSEKKYIITEEKLIQIPLPYEKKISIIGKKYINILNLKDKIMDF